MRSLVPGRDFRSPLNSGSHKRKVFGCFCDSQWRFVWKIKMFVLSPFGWWRINTSLNNRINFNGLSTVAKNQGDQFSQCSDVTNGRLVSSSAYFPRNMTLKYKMKLSEGSWDKILHSRTRCFWKDFFFSSGGLSLDRMYQSSGSSFRASFVKTTKES